MEEEKALIIKPPFWFRVQLFLFMTLVIRNFVVLISNFNSNWYCDFRFSWQIFIISSVIDFFAFSYAFIAIYKALQRKSYGIMMLKFSVVYLLIHSFTDIPLIYIPSIIFYVIFLLYLFRSKDLKTYIPLQKRTFGKYGIMALAIYFFWCFFSVYYTGEELYKSHRSTLVSPEEIQLEQGQITDSLTIFKPLSTWTNDTISIDGHIYAFSKKDGSYITIASAIGECKSRIDYYNMLSEIDNAQTTYMKEVAYSDSIINGFKYYSNTYEIDKSEGQPPCYWTFSMLVPNNSYKIIALSYFEIGDYNNSVKESVEFMQSVEFDLKKRRVVHKSIDKINDCDNNNQEKDAV